MKIKFKHPEAGKVIALGQRFDEIEADEAQYGALIMLITGYAVTNIDENEHEEFINELMGNIKQNIQAFKEFSKNELAGVKTQGNA